MAINLLNENRIIINNKQKMTIENFRNIIEFKEENIIIDNISVKGNNLRINEINEFKKNLSKSQKTIFKCNLKKHNNIE